MNEQNILKILRDQFLNDPTIPKLEQLFACLMDSKLYVPMNLNITEEDAASFATSKVGDTITLQNEMKMKPDWLKNGDVLFFPIFSSIEEAPEDYRKNFSWINLRIDDCITFARNNKECAGIVLDAFTRPYPITDKILDALEENVKRNRNNQ